jgi:hypothetical protein
LVRQPRQKNYLWTSGQIQRRGWGTTYLSFNIDIQPGAIGNALLETEKERGQKIPPLNALIVNAATGIPGDGCDYYLSTYLNKRGEVWRFQDWNEILLSYGLKPIKGGIPGIPSLQTDITPRKPRKTGWSTGPESEADKALKNWVAKNPRVIKSKTSCQAGTTEWLFASNLNAVFIRV